MNWLSSIFTTTGFKIALVGAFGGIAPKLIELVQRLSANDFPESGFYYALGLLAVFGVVAVMISGETNLKKALAIGAGAPAIIGSLTSNVVASNPPGMIMPFGISIVNVASAEPMPTPQNSVRLTLLVGKNESPFQLEALWIRVNNTTLRYQLQGRTVTFDAPEGTGVLEVTMPTDTKGLSLKITDLDPLRPIGVRIVSNRTSKEFWQTFGGVRGPTYRIELDR